MEFHIDGNPDYGHLTIELGPGERVVAEGGSRPIWPMSFATEER